jgi:hypothetical protein
MKTTFDFYEDPAHGWAKVPVKLLQQLGIAERVSHYSYRKGSMPIWRRIAT